MVFFLLIVAARGRACSMPASACVWTEMPGERMSIRKSLEASHRPVARRSFVIVSPALLFFLWMAVALAEIRGRQRSLSAGVHPRPHRLEELCRACSRVKRFVTVFHQQPDRRPAPPRWLALLVGVPAGYGIARMNAHKAAVVILIVAHHARPVLPDPAVPAVPVARVARHAGAADHHRISW